MALTHPTGLLRERRPHAHAPVTPVELFFDLVFVFAITQLSHALVDDLTPGGALRWLVLFVAIWWAWVNTAWVTNWLSPDRGATRLMLFALMLAGMLAAIAVPYAFGKLGLLFAASYVAIELGRSLFTIWAIGPAERALRRNFLRILCWQAAAAPFWIGGALVEDTARILFWILALGIWTAAPAVGFRVPVLGRSTTTDWTVDGAHMAERCSLFVIIALGESILVTGASFAKLDWSAPVTAAFLAAFGGTVAMWWIYFHIGAERGARLIRRDDDPGRLARLGYTYLHAPIVAGIVLTAVADERVLHHPAGHAGLADIAVILGGPALFLAGLSAFKRLSLGWPPLSHSIGLGLLAATALASPWLPPLALSAIATAILVVVAVWEHASLASGNEA